MYFNDVIAEYFIEAGLNPKNKQPSRNQCKNCYRWCFRGEEAIYEKGRARRTRSNSSSRSVSIVQFHENAADSV